MESNPQDGNGLVAVVGSLNYDLVVPVEHHPTPGETVLGGNYFKTPGGKGANQAVAAARLGQHVAMIGRVGRDEFGQELLEALKRDGVDTAHTQATPEAPTGVAFIQVSTSGENSIVVSPGANALLSPDDVRAAASLLDKAAVTLLQLEVPLETIRAAAELASGTVILNPAPAQALPQDLLENIDVIVPNQGELARLLGAAPPETLEEVAELARCVPGSAAVVVTLGAQGALLVVGDETKHVPGVPVEVVDTTAAGDCFCGALADALARGNDLAEAVNWAVQAAALAVTRPGAQASLPRRHELADLVH